MRVRPYIVHLLRIAGGGGSVLSQLLVTRTLDMDAAGAFFLGINTLMLLSAFCKLGLDQVLVRNSAGAFARHNAAHAFNELKAVSLRVIISGIIATSLAELVALILLWLDVISTSTLTPIIILLLGVLPLSLLSLWGEFIRALDHADFSVLVQWVLPPALFLAVVLLIPKNTVIVFCFMYVLSYCVVTLLTMAWIRRMVHSSLGDRAEWELKDALRAPIQSWNPSLLLVAVLFVIIGWISSLLVGIFADMQQVALFNVALRASSLVVLIMAASNSYFGPMFASAYSIGLTDKLRNVTKTATRMNAILCMPILSVLWVLAPEVLRLFGNNYDSASTLLRILILGQVANVLTGPASQLLMMTGHDRAQRNALLLSGFLTSVLLVSLTPLWGLTGAGLAMSVGGIAVSAYTFYQAKTLLGINPSIF